MDMLATRLGNREWTGRDDVGLQAGRIGHRGKGSNRVISSVHSLIWTPQTILLFRALKGVMSPLNRNEESTGNCGTELLEPSKSTIRSKPLDTVSVTRADFVFVEWVGQNTFEEDQENASSNW